MCLKEQLKALEERITKLESPTHFQDRWLTVPELAEEMKVSQSTIRRRIKDKTIYSCKVFGAVRIPIKQFYGEGDHEEA